MKDLSDIFEIQKTCEYKGEVYHVRDNGYVFRLRRPNKRKRPLDEKWTLGNVDKQRGYLNFSSEVVHRIVATAFHEKPSDKHVVDHIDTNKQNNRPENLRWVTKLENAVRNPITARRIELVCGSVEAFLADPSKFSGKFQNPNYEWMCAVSKEEAQISKGRLLAWAKSNKPLQGGTLGDWIFGRINSETEPSSPNYILSKTPNAAQRIYSYNDKPNEFPCTPQTIEGNPLKMYYENLKEGKVFFRNHNGEYVVVKSGFSKDRQSIHILTRANYVHKEDQVIPISKLQKKVSIKDLQHALDSVTYEDHLFVHSHERGIFPREYLEQIFADCTQDN